MIFKITLTSLLLIFSTLSIAKINVVTTTTDLKWLTEQIGRDKVMVESLLSGTEDPHYIDAMPHFIAKVAKADMFCLVGRQVKYDIAAYVSRFLMKTTNIMAVGPA